MATTLSPRTLPSSRVVADATTFPAHTKAYLNLSATVRDLGLMRRTPRFYTALGAGLVAAVAGCVAGFILIGDSWFQLLIAAALGIVFTQIAFVAHEAAHRQVLSVGPRSERLARLLAGSVGLSYAWWDSKHARHHGNPNRVGRDPDIARDTISFVEEDARAARGPLRLITRYQGWLFFPLLTLEGLNLHVQSYRHLLAPGDVKGRWTELAIITARIALVVVPAFLVLPLGMAFAFVGLQLAVFGVYMGASFAPNHKGMPLVAHSARLDFFTKQVRTSRNISGGWWATWLMGGLNYQVEHHLFPSMPRPHLARTAQLVREYCAAHGVPYTETSLWNSYGIVIRYLNEVGLSARDPFDCPVAARFGRG